MVCAPALEFVQVRSPHQSLISHSQLHLKKMADNLSDASFFKRAKILSL